MNDRPSSSSLALRASPLPASLSLTFLGSVGAGVVTSGIYFITKHTYAFSDIENYWLGLAQGITYILGAIASGPALRGIRTVLPGVSTRAVLAAVLLALGGLCFLPVLAAWTGFGSGWPVWVLMGLYSPLTGVLWPIVESFVSGGRSGTSLRSAIGRFNITWSAALVVSYCAISRLVEHHGAEAIAAVGGVHLASLALLAFLGREPGRHFHGDGEPHPAVYSQLLVTFRILLPASYLVLTALTPYLPSVLRQLGVEAGWQTVIVAVWLASRSGSFMLLERWHGWRGRWALPVVGGGLLLLGFAVSVLSPRLGGLTGGEGAGLAWLVGGLLAFGTGMASIYAGALYYAMAVGQAEVEAGGMHEALIGLGYAVGPMCGLLAAGAVRAGAVQEGWFGATMLSITAVIACAAAVWAVWRAWRVAQAGGIEPVPVNPKDTQTV